MPCRRETDRPSSSPRSNRAPADLVTATCNKHRERKDKLPFIKDWQVGWSVVICALLQLASGSVRVAVSFLQSSTLALTQESQPLNVTVRLHRTVSQCSFVLAMFTARALVPPQSTSTPVRWCVQNCCWQTSLRRSWNALTGSQLVQTVEVANIWLKHPLVLSCGRSLSKLMTYLLKTCRQLGSSAGCVWLGLNHLPLTIMLVFSQSLLTNP